jgi:hypothetical protein
LFHSKKINAAYSVLFCLECVDNNNYKEVDKEEMSHYHIDDKEQCPWDRAMTLISHYIKVFSCPYSLNDYIWPASRRCHNKKRNQSIWHCVEIEHPTIPYATIVQTFPFIYVRLHVLLSVRAVEHLPFEVADQHDGEYWMYHDHDQCDVYDVRNSEEQGSHCHLQALILANQSYRSEDTEGLHHSEGIWQCSQAEVWEN